MICNAKDCWCYNEDTPCTEEVLVLDENGRCDRFITAQPKFADSFEVLKHIARIIDEAFQ